MSGANGHTRALITGVTGLLGSHLAEHLIDQQGVTVFGLKRWRTPASRIGPAASAVELIDGDITDPGSVLAAVDAVQPDWVFHFAAQSYSQESLIAPQATFETNVLGTINVLEALKRVRPGARVVVAGSSASLGEIAPEDAPVDEDYRLAPTTPYGSSKAAQELLALQYARHGMHVCVARFFLQVGPRQGERTSIQAFARQIAAIERGTLESVIRVGNLWPIRDFTDARDSVRAAQLILREAPSGTIFNVCQGTGRTIREILDGLLALTPAAIEVSHDPSRVRSVDEAVTVGSNARLRKATGWKPEVPWETTLRDVLDHWRGHE